MVQRCFRCGSCTPARGTNGRIGHALLKVGDTCMMVSDEYPVFDKVAPGKSREGR